MNKNRIIKSCPHSFYILYFIFFILLLSCTTQVNDSKASLTGKVELTGSQSHEGVTVAIYELATLDTTIVRINNEYPQIGVIISQETEFDHRLQTPVKYVQTDIAGNFKLDGIQPGKYNVALLKEGWSLKYLYNINLIEGDNTLADHSSFIIHNSQLNTPPCHPECSVGSPIKPLASKTSITLIPSVTMPSVITEPYTFQSNIQYNFNSNTTITAPVTIESGARLCIAPLKKIESYNTVTFNSINSDYWNLTSTYNINILNPTSIIDSIYYFDRVNITTTNSLELKQGIIKFIRSGINISSPSPKIENCLFDHNLNALAIQGGDIEIMKVLHKNSRDRSIYTTFNQANTINNLNYHHSISFNNKIGNDLYDINSQIENSYFILNENNIKTWSKLHEIKNNNFDQNNKSIIINGGFGHISFNILLSNFDSDILFTGSSSNKSSGVIQNCNFYEKSNLYLKISPSLNYIQTVVENINATNNYFINNDISNQLYDKYDSEFIFYEFFYNPRANNPIANAGIQ